MDGWEKGGEGRRAVEIATSAWEGLLAMTGGCLRGRGVAGGIAIACFARLCRTKGRCQGSEGGMETIPPFYTGGWRRVSGGKWNRMSEPAVRSRRFDGGRRSGWAREAAKGGFGLRWGRGTSILCDS